MLSKLVFTALLLGLLAAFVASNEGARYGSLAPGVKNETYLPWCHDKCSHRANLTDADFKKYKCAGPCKPKVGKLPPSVTDKNVHHGTPVPVKNGDTVPWCNENCTKGIKLSAADRKKYGCDLQCKLKFPLPTNMPQ